MKRLLTLLALAVGLAACGTVDSGRGWELLIFDRSGPVYTAVIAHNQDDLDRMWDRFSLRLTKPQVDFEEEVVIGLGHAVSSSCPEITFRGLAIEDDHVYGVFRKGTLRLTGGCTADATPAMFWLAVDRQVLPERFNLSLTKEKICLGCPEEATVVDMNAPNVPKPWWAEPRLGIAVEGVPGSEYHLVETVPAPTDGSPIMTLWGGWVDQFNGRPSVYFDRAHPSRIEVYSAFCPAGLECPQGRAVRKGDLACGLDIEIRDREDFTAVVTFHEDGTCTAHLEEGLDWPH